MDGTETGQNNFMGSNGFTTFGIINALKTGDMHTDMIVAMCIPFLLRILFGWVKKFETFLDFEKWIQWYFRQDESPEEHKRCITYNTTRNYQGRESNLDVDSENWVLQKAIKLYVHHVLKLKLKTGNLNLMYGEFGKSKEDDDDEEIPRKTLWGVLQQYNVVSTLPNDRWYNLGAYGNDPPSPVRLCIETNQSKEGGDDDKKKDTTATQTNSITYRFTSPGVGAIEDFVDKGYKWYLEELRKTQDDSRHLYEMKVPDTFGVGGDGEGRSGSSNIRYKRYKLSNEKSFDSLFFRQKENLLNIVDHFMAKSGKYAISGYPYKLGLLLHGPPGTGKTSLIKALAQYTGRSIVNVPLSCVSTNSELMSIFLDKKYRVEGSDIPTQLRFKDVIFVMEDVDAASRVVKSRTGRPTDGEFDADNDPLLQFPEPKSLWKMFVESEASVCQELVKELSAKSEKLKTSNSEYLRSACKRISAFPGLGLVGEAAAIDVKTSHLCNEAIVAAEGLIGQHSKLDGILATHAKSINRLLRNGTEIDDEFVEDLLRDIQSMSDVVQMKGSESSFSLNDNSSQASPKGPLELEEELSPTDTASGSSGGGGGGGGGGDKMGPSGWWGRINPDQLSLSGLLNVLDGVVDTPGRILIMTTNHPEMLDPALIRPGRIDKKIMLGHMARGDVKQMLEHCFQAKLSNDQAERVDRLFDTAKSPVKMTPAQVEQLAAEHDSLEDMVLALAKKY